jgi:hypothetical protein
VHRRRADSSAREPSEPACDVRAPSGIVGALLSVSRVAWGQLFAIFLLFILILYIISLYLAMYICACHVWRLPAHAGTRAHKPGMQLARAPALCRTRPHITRFAVCGRASRHSTLYTCHNIQYVALVCVRGLSSFCICVSIHPTVTV